MTDQNDFHRRTFLKRIAAATGGVALMPLVTSCRNSTETVEKSGPASKPAAAGPATQPGGAPSATTVPATEPAGWDPIAFNRARGNAGMIPDSYLDEINGPDGEKKHLGKHLPYVPELEAGLVPEGMIALMWGDPAKGYARHPNAARGPENDHEGHWYNWIRIRPAVEGEAEEVTSQYAEWPGTPEQREELYVVAGGGDITADGGRNTVYLAKLPEGLKKGDPIRIWAHCLTHGEYVDFITVA